MNRLPPVQWLRRRPSAGDALLACVVTIVSMGALWGGSRHIADARDPDALGTLLILATTLPLAFRRRNPIVVLAVVSTAQFAVELLGYHGANWLPVFIALYTVAAHTNGKRRTVTAKVFVLAVAVLFAAGFVEGEAELPELISSAVFLTGAFILGDNLQRRRRASAELAERAERADRERELLARQRAHDERSRIARELHDVVAHSVSLMIIQAGAARRSIATSPLQAEKALHELETTGRHAMDELRRVLGVLRAGDEATALELSPQPSLQDVRQLVESDPTLPVRLVEIGVPPGEVPSSVGLSLYRVVQEALTNVRKHAGHVKHVTVQLVYAADSVAVQVTDDGRGASAAANAFGHGLAGMRERMALCGGSVTVGPRAGGGWQVRASAPLRGAAASELVDALVDRP